MNEFWSMALSWGKTIVDWYWGGFDDLFASLTLFVLIAHITDGMCAVVDHKSLGKASIQEVFKSILIFILVGIGNILDANILADAQALRTVIILFYLSVEGMAILENVVYLGLPVPEQLKEILEQMRQKRLGST